MARYLTGTRKLELQKLLKRDHSLQGGVLFGLDGYVIQLQARAIEIFEQPTSWRAAVTITGMPRGAIREALDRISGAFAKLEIPHPEVEIIVNLAPPDLPKEGTWLDLPLAIIILQAAGLLPDIPEATEKNLILLGEVGLHGEIRRVPGVLSMAFAATAGQKLVVPAGNERECALILAKPGHEGCGVFPVDSLSYVIDCFSGRKQLENALKQGITFEEHIPRCADFSQIRGQDRAKMAATIAAAGGHNLLLIGPPGEGKSLLACSIPGILPKLTNAEKVELTRIYSACGELERDGLAVTRRPYRKIHHTSSKQSIIGGGSGVPRPGEITLSHLGILFLDEIAEFSSSTLDTLRQPMEDGEVHISRVGGTLSYPCRFTLVAAMNPCPCGYFGSDRCNCKEPAVRKYQKKLSGPILDRIDLQVEMTRLSSEDRFSDEVDESSASISQRIELARERQRERFDGIGIHYNAAIPGGRVRELCAFSEGGFATYRETVDGSLLTTRSMDRLAKVARTIADLEASASIEPAHVRAASSFVVGGMLRDA